MLKRVPFLFLLFLLASCAVKKEKPVRVILSPIKIGTKPKVFQLHPNKEIDILHTTLDVSFDWKDHLCFGEEEILFTPYFYPLDSFSLDAKQFIFKEVVLSQNGREINYTKKYDDAIITFFLDKKITTADTLKLFLKYTAQPDKATGEGSQAIKDAKGLYFINTAQKEPFKPMQIWTQGETESNSNWFATIDKPFEKIIFDIHITVPDSMTTLSNGLLLKSIQNANNTRTDFWHMEQPMSAYLVMMAIGNFQKTTDTWRSKEVSYFLEPAYHPYAKNIFQHTSEMLEFFSTKLGVEYPWQKYAQVVVRDYVSGAMENTSATLHGEFVQKNNRELIDKQNDGIIAHELFHQWFGDLVTCESWSHLTLNEGFATFGEQLWFGYKYGEEAELKHIHKSMNQYLVYSQRDDDPIVRFYYADKEEMFNRITYQKGARVLNLLKFTLGEKAFYEAVKNYLENFSYKAAELENFRHELEKTTGKDLRYFFNQWFLRGGHPVVEVSTTNNNNSLEVTICQTQEDSLFSFPFQIRYGSALQTIECSKKITSLIIPLQRDTENIYLDPNGIFIGEIINKTVTDENLLSYYQGAQNYIEKIQTLETIKKKKSKSAQEDALLLFAMNDTDPDISYFAMQIIDWEIESNLDRAKEDLKHIATFSKNPDQKSQAIYILSATNDKLLASEYVRWSADGSYKVAAASLYALQKIKKQEALELAKELEKDAEVELFEQVSTTYSILADSNLTFFQDNLMKRFGTERNNLIKDYGIWAKRFGLDIQNEFWQQISQRAKNDENDWTRFYAFQALLNITNENDVLPVDRKTELINMAEAEKDQQIRKQLQRIKLLPTETITNEKNSSIK